MAFWRRKTPWSGDMAARRVVRSDIARRLAAHLPDVLEGAFFGELLARWPEAPTLSAPVSQLCTAAQFEEPDYARLCGMMNLKPRLHRKQWEFAFLLRAVEAAGMLRPGARGLGFGVGRERLPSVFAAQGCAVLATDLPAEDGANYWVGGPQHAASLEAMRRPGLISAEDFAARVAFRPVNMKAIPEDLADFDFCWSACALEHLGGLDEGLNFIRASLATLKPGGLAVHTTEFNLGSAEKTLKKGGTVVYREKDLVAFAEALRAEGHEITLNLSPGATPTDRMIDRFHDSDIHLRLYVRHKIPATSVGIAVRKAG